MRFAITREDVLKGKVVDPGFYKVKIKGIVEGVAGPKSANPGSATVAVHYSITEGKFKDVPLQSTFSELAPGMAVPFFNALLPADKRITDKDDNPELPEFDEKLIGLELQVNVVNNMYNGKPQNNIQEYRPLAGK